MRLARVFGLAVAVALAAAASAAADPPKVEKAEYKVSAGQPLRVVVAGKDIGYKAAFTEDQAFFEELRPKDDGERRFMFQAATPGRYAIVFWTKGETDGTFTTIVVGDGKPVVTDPKDKKAIDTPVKKIGRVVIVTDARNPKAAFLVNVYQNNQAFNDYYAKGRRDHQWGLLASVDKDVIDKEGKPPKEFAPLIQASGGKTYPQYFVVATDGTVLEQGDLPTDPATLISTLQKLGGK
jgi:hypothetical protein